MTYQFYSYILKRKAHMSTQKRVHECSSSIFHICQEVETTQVSINRCMGKIQSIHIVEYYSAIKRNEAMTHATMWMKRENVMLSKRNQTQKGDIVYDSTYMKYPELVNL